MKTNTKTNKVLNVVGIILCAILIPILIVNCTLIIKSFIHKDDVPDFLGVLPMIVLSPSMQPDIMEGDLIICVKTEAEEIEVGQVISFFDPAGKGTMVVTHKVDEIFEENEEKILCGMRIQAIPTPGHTAGSVCYLVTDNEGDRYLFTGDTLFLGSIGRTDFPTGNIGELRASLRLLSALDGDMPIYPGHNEESTLEHERKTNPFMQDL